jgi:hypothetical protein
MKNNFSSFLSSEYNKRSNRLNFYLSKLKSSLKRNERGCQELFSEGSCWTGRQGRKGLVGTLSSAERLAWPTAILVRCCQRQSSTCQMRAVVTRGDHRHHRWARDGGLEQRRGVVSIDPIGSQKCHKDIPTVASLVCISGGRARARLSAFPFS